MVRSQRPAGGRPRKSASSIRAWSLMLGSPRPRGSTPGSSGIDSTSATARSGRRRPGRGPGSRGRDAPGKTRDRAGASARPWPRRGRIGPGAGRASRRASPHRPAGTSTERGTTRPARRTRAPAPGRSARRPAPAPRRSWRRPATSAKPRRPSAARSLQGGEGLVEEAGGPGTVRVGQRQGDHADRVGSIEAQGLADGSIPRLAVDEPPCPGRVLAGHRVAERREVVRDRVRILDRRQQRLGPGRVDRRRCP